jgi:formylglycine-generating enzyme required for sulfatase activity
MLGQVPAKVSTENGEIRPGDSLTSSALYPGYVARAKAGDPTVGIALESLMNTPQDKPAGQADASATTSPPAPLLGKEGGAMATSSEENLSTSTEDVALVPPPYQGGGQEGVVPATKGTINVLIARRNKSLTVEEVEQKVVERIAAMEIEDEVQIMVEQAVSHYDFDPVVSDIIGGELAALSGTFDSKLTVQKDELTNLINSKATSTQAALVAIATRVDANSGLISDFRLQISDLSQQLTDANLQILELEQRLDSISSTQISSSTLTVINSGDGNIAEFKNASTTILAIKANGSVVVADDVALAFGNDELVKFAYNSKTGRMEILGTNKDLYIGLGMGQMIIGGAMDALTPQPPLPEGEGGLTLKVRGSTEVKTNASSTTAALTVEQDGSGNIVEFKTATFAVMTIKSGGEVQVASGNQTICVGACPATETFTPTNEGDLGVEQSVYAQDYRVHCPEGWVEVPRDNKHTFQNFCVMKNEYALTPQPPLPEGEGETPLTNVNLAEAKNYCRALGEGYHLVTDAEWLTIAEQIAGLPINDMSDANPQINANLQIANGITGGDAVETRHASSLPTDDPNVNDCNLYKKLSDPGNAFSPACQISGTNGNTSDFGYTDTGANFSMTYDPAQTGRASLRTAVLPNGQIIWDIAGNAAEWVDEIANADDGPISSTPASGWLEYSDVVKYGNMSAVRPSGYWWTSANGIGQLYSDYDAGSELRGSVRGGSFQDGEKAGVFALNLSKSPEYKGEDVGFRCAR